MLCEKDLQGIKEFCIKHTFSDRENSYFMERPIWKGKNYEDVLKNMEYHGKKDLILENNS